MKTIYLEDDRLNKRKFKKFLKKIYKINKKEDVIIALCKNLQNQEEINNLLNYYGIKVLNGRWILKFLLLEILNYIELFNKIKLEKLRVAILICKLDEIILKQIPQIAKHVKTLKIITNLRYQFMYIEKEMYEKHGIAIQITNNKKKSLQNVDIILNFDFSQELIEKYNISSNAIFVNIEQNKYLNISNFYGRVINDYEIEYDEDKFDNSINKEEFEHNILYESYIYRRDTFENIKKQMKEDNVKLLKLK